MTSSPSVQPASKSALPRLAAREFFAVTLWVSTTLFLVVAANTLTLHRFSTTLQHFPPFQKFLIALVLAMAIWESLGLGLGSPLNPSVTIACAIARRRSMSEAATMIAAEFSGHVIGVIAVRWLTPLLFVGISDSLFAPPQPHDRLSLPAAVVIEAVITAVLCAAILAIDDVLPPSASVRKFSVIATLVVLILSVFAEWTGSCMNPAMSFALAMMHGHWAAHIVYWIGPVCGAVGAGLWYDAYVSKHAEARRARRRLVYKRTLKQARKQPYSGKDIPPERKHAITTLRAKRD